MKKLILFFTFFLIFQGVYAQSCYDSDNGLNYYTKGYVKFDNTTYYDNCVDEQTLIEGYCEDGYFKTTTYYCPSGCENGVCIIKAESIGITGRSKVLIPQQKGVTPMGTPVIEYGIGVYWDAACTNPVYEIDWGTLYIGGSKSVTVYIRNEGSEPGYLYMVTENWNPTWVAYYLHLTWDYNEQQLDPNEVIQVTLTLTLDYDIVDDPHFDPSQPIDFTFDIVIGDPAGGTPPCYTPGFECDGKNPYETWCVNRSLEKRCTSDCQVEEVVCPTTAVDTDGGFAPDERGKCYERGCHYGKCGAYAPYEDVCAGGYEVSYAVKEYYPAGESCKYKYISCGGGILFLYLCEKGRCTSKKSATGCPYLLVYNGEIFTNLGILNLHSTYGVDTIDLKNVAMKPYEEGTYRIILKEASYLWWEGSHIDYVRLKDSTGKECKLIKAVHSKLGDVTPLISESDDSRVETKPGQSIELTYSGCSGNDFTFEIEGFNPILYPWKPIMLSISSFIENYSSVAIILLTVIIIGLIIAIIKIKV